MAKPGNNDTIDNEQDEGLQKEIGTWGVYCVATGAMFSSGFFLLPGLAAAHAGPAAVVAYLVAGMLMVPSMLSMLELATALPRAGGAYYFLDRSLGPAMGAVTGLGTWLALVLKVAFALVGIGAYLAVMPGIGQLLAPGTVGTVWTIKIAAVALAVVFTVVNVLGVRESTRMQAAFVVTILVILGFFLVEGLWHVGTNLPEGQLAARYTPFLHPDHGWHGLLSTVGLVFVSYAGLTQAASISEEVRDPERSLPLGMILALVSVTVVYVVGVFIIVAVVDAPALHTDLAPVATAAKATGTWLPGGLVRTLIVIAALAAFASTGNAGILAASRFPLAMAEDRLLPPQLAVLGRFQTPTRAVVLTGGMTVLAILVLSAEGVAKFGSTFNLLVFALVNVAVIVMRESRIESYDPGFRVPLYPWLPLAGSVISGWLIVELGWGPVLFSLLVVLAALIGYVRYGRPRVDRRGAIHHVFARLGRYRHPGLKAEFREIIKEKGLREDDPFDDIVARAEVFDADPDEDFDSVVQHAAASLAERVDLAADEIAERLLDTGRYGGAPIARGAVLLHFRHPAVSRAEMVLVRARAGLCVDLPPDDRTQPEGRSCEVTAILVLLSPEEATGQHLRILAELADRAEDDTFMDTWRRLESPAKLKECLLRDARFLELFVGADSVSRELCGREVRDLELPAGAFLALVRRGGDSFEPRGKTVLEDGDHLTFIGEPDAIARLDQRFIETDEG